MDCLFKGGAPVIEQLMNAAGLEQIPNSQEHFDVIKRLVQKIGRPAMQGPAFAFLVNISSKDDDRQVDYAPLGTQGFENSEPINMRHA